MITVRINGIEFECESAMDAAELAKLMVPAFAPINIPAPKHIQKPVELKPAIQWPITEAINKTYTNQVLPLDTPNGKLQKLPKDVLSFISDLSTVAGKVMEGDELSSALRLKSKHGLGPRFSSLQKALALRNIDLDQLVRKSSANSRERSWTVATKEQIELTLKNIGM